MRHLSLARQLALLQGLIVLVVLAAVVGVPFAKIRSEFRDEAGDRARDVAETVATEPLVRAGLVDPGRVNAITPTVSRTQDVSGVSYIVVLDSNGHVVGSQDPALIRQAWNLSGSAVLSNRAWVGESRTTSSPAVESHVPIIDPATSRTVGYAVVGMDLPTLWEQLRDQLSRLVFYIALGMGLGFLGSALLARRIKRQTLGLEPRDIAGLMEHREALLHGIREGIIGLDNAHRVTLVNDEAIRLLRLPPDTAGRTLEDLAVEPRLVEALTKPGDDVDRPVIAGDRLLVLNGMPVTARQQVIGTVVTLRDRTELVGLRRELDVTRLTADSLRAQSHEFTNRLHTISGLLQLRRPERAIEYIRHIHAVHNELVDTTSRQIEDPSLAALIIAKSSVAHERGVEFKLAPSAFMPEVPIDFAADLETVIGNFVDNAMDAVIGDEDSWVELDLRTDNGWAQVTVRDSGPGIDDVILDQVFVRGVSTKTDQSESHGIGLALAELVCRRRGGSVSARNDNGAVFEARIPLPK